MKIMNKTKNNRNRSASIISMLFMFAIAISSCSKDDSATTPTEQNQSLGLIKVTGEDASTATKTTLDGVVTSWVAEDKVGIFSPQARTVSNGTIAITNAEFSAQSSANRSLFNGTMYWGTGEHKFYAYYPYKSGAFAATAVPVSVPSEQTQSEAGNTDHIAALDFLVATPVTVAAGTTGDLTNGINLRYNHLFSVLEFNISGNYKRYIRAVDLNTSGTPLSFDGTIDITKEGSVSTPSVSTYNQKVKVTLTNRAKITATDTKIYLLFNPASYSGDWYSDLYLEQEDGFLDMQANVAYKKEPTGGFVRGKKYKVIIGADISGNFYSCVTIGEQVWMTRNLLTALYNNSNGSYFNEAIPKKDNDVNGSSSWAGLTGGAYSIIDPGYEHFGYLYNGYAINTEKLCPSGWHVPTKAEWVNMINILGGPNSATANKMIESYETLYWDPHNTAASNSSRFSARGTGKRMADGSYADNKHKGYWWTADSKSVIISADGITFDETPDLKSGFAVRCVKN